MLTAQELARFPINPLLLEWVPEEIARKWSVLPVAVEDDRPHLILPADSPAYPDDLYDTLRFVLGRSFTYDLAPIRDLAPLVELHYAAVNSPIARCGGAELKFRCPAYWINLQPTDDVRVRHCDICNRRVTYCTTLGEYQKLASEHECVAYFDPREQTEYLGEP